MAKPPCSRRASGSVMLVHTSALRAFAKTRSVGLVLREDVTRSDTWEGCPTCASTTRRRGNHWEDRPASITRAMSMTGFARPSSGQPALLKPAFSASSRRPRRHRRRFPTPDGPGERPGHGLARRPCSRRTTDSSRGPPGRVLRVSSPSAAPHPARTKASRGGCPSPSYG
jgi:hypothetical protein